MRLGILGVYEYRVILFKGDLLGHRRRIFPILFFISLNHDEMR